MSVIFIAFIVLSYATSGATSVTAMPLNGRKQNAHLPFSARKTFEKMPRVPHMWKKKSVRSNHESRCSRVDVEELKKAEYFFPRVKTGLDSGTCTFCKQLRAILGYFHESERITISLNFSPLTRFFTYGSEKNIPKLVIRNQGK